MRGGQTSESRSHEELVDCLYDWVEHEQAWSHVQTQFMRHFEADKANIFLVGAGGRVLEDQIEGYRLEAHLPYHELFRDQDPRMRLAMAHPGQVLSDVEVIAQAEYLKSPIYNEWLGPAGVRYTMFVKVDVGPDLFAAQAIMRPHTSKPFGPEEVARFQRLLPHLQRAIRLRQVLLASRQEARDLRRALDLAGLPLAILDATGRVLCASERAAPMLESGYGLMLRQQRLSAVAPGDANAISHALALTTKLAEPTALRTPATDVPPVVNIPQPDGHHVSLIFMPLRPPHGLRELGDRRARALVMLHDPRVVVRLNPELLARVHALTPTEAQLAAALAEGATLEAFAQERGTSVQTARTHLKRILEKTGTRRQADLVRLLLGSAAVHLTGAR